ncbi:hypothetical protein P3X46_009910 [Hevea brasiliensis]|uniref:DUF7054 domain-containing protein n=1 Tax=Hevea brasiliensis TaxID=3981 RepID=A0ABQ9MF46_HEVBR|nr:hypothetical protein P3X46_009910 [Hevea brasiliensis]
MPTTPKSNRKGQDSEKSRKNRLTEKASSFHGRIPVDVPKPRIHRPNTLPDLLGGRRTAGVSTEARPKLTKLLLNVTIQGSVGAVQILMSPESTVSDLIAFAIRQYTKEGRRPIVSADPSKFDLHYSQFSLESKIINHDFSDQFFPTIKEVKHVKWRFIEIETCFFPFW